MKFSKTSYLFAISALILAGWLGGVSAEPTNSAQSANDTGSQSPGTTASGTPAKSVTSAKPGAPAVRPAPVWQGFQANRVSRRADMYYQGGWGVGDLHVKATESGELIRFNYRVLDPAKAATLNDKKVEPKLFDPQAGVVLTVPQLEKVGALRQSSTPKAGMNYWMAFANPTLVVKRGHRVDVVIGSFRATNLVVE
ncbi:MAG: hypothetical protein P4M04_05395 [Acidobacteriota bacterium]|nr:hypothetical protein [Acidobacteriota bacterium]